MSSQQGKQPAFCCLTLSDPPFEVNLKSWEGARGVQAFRRTARAPTRRYVLSEFSIEPRAYARLTGLTMRVSTWLGENKA